MNDVRSEDRPAGADGLVWHRMHPITPVLNAWKTIAALLVIAAWQLGPQSVNEWGLDAVQALFGLLGLLLVGGLIGAGYSALAWRVTQYAIDDQRVHLHSGVLFRRQRQARLDRIQAVDVVQPLLARIVGLAQLTIEQAGGQDSRVVLAYVTEARAHELRNEILARAAGIDLESPHPEAAADQGLVGSEPAAGIGGAPADGGPPAWGEGAAQAGAVPGGGAVPVGGPAPVGGAVPPTGTVPTGAVPTGAVPTGAVPTGAVPPVAPRPVARLLAPEAPERELYAVPVGRVLASIVLSGAMIGLVVVVVGIASGAIATRSFATFGLMLPALLASGGYIWTRFSGEFAFRAAISPDGIRLRHGLTEARAQTVPPGRVQAVRLSQPLLWRRMDWWRVVVNVAGYAESDTSKENVLLPVGSREEALLALWLVLPDLGEDPLPVLAAALTGRDDDAGFISTPRRARWLDPLGWRRNGWRVTPAALILRRGRLERVVDVVPHERTQSLGLRQGPLQRRFGVSSLVVHSTPGPVGPRVEHLDAATAAELIMVQAARARSARAAAPPERWMRRP